jgi:hypothetical protein
MRFNVAQLVIFCRLDRQLLGLKDRRDRVRFPCNYSDHKHRVRADGTCFTCHWPTRVEFTEQSGDESDVARDENKVVLGVSQRQCPSCNCPMSLSWEAATLYDLKDKRDIFIHVAKCVAGSCQMRLLPFGGQGACYRSLVHGTCFRSIELTPCTDGIYVFTSKSAYTYTLLDDLASQGPCRALRQAHCR